MKTQEKIKELEKFAAIGKAATELMLASEKCNLPIDDLIEFVVAIAKQKQNY